MWRCQGDAGSVDDCSGCREQFGTRRSSLRSSSETYSGVERVTGNMGTWKRVKKEGTNALGRQWERTGGSYIGTVRE